MNGHEQARFDCRHDRHCTGGQPVGAGIGNRFPRHLASHRHRRQQRWPHHPGDHARRFEGTALPGQIGRRCAAGVRHQCRWSETQRQRQHRPRRARLSGGRPLQGASRRLHSAGGPPQIHDLQAFHRPHGEAAGCARRWAELARGARQHHFRTDEGALQPGHQGYRDHPAHQGDSAGGAAERRRVHPPHQGAI